MAAAWAQWDHVTKIDPDKALPDGDTYAAIATTGTDALILGGTTNVTESSVQSILAALTPAKIPIFVEPTYRECDQTDAFLAVADHLADHFALTSREESA